MISIRNLGVEFNSTPLFNNVSFVINKRDKIALVGKNGAGKSTMLKIIAGLQSPTSGVVATPKDLTIGYLPQQMVITDERTVVEEVRTVFGHLDEMKSRLKCLNSRLAESTDYDSEEYAELIDKISNLSDIIAMEESENGEAELEKTLLGLGFVRTDFDRNTSEFSGGWRMRIELAKILLRNPDVLLLDEPTNHLDIESIEWLESYLALCRSSIVVISHDRKFLDTVTNRTVEIMLGHIHDYKVPYSKYLELRAERMEQQRAAFENQQRMIEKTEAFIEKFRYKPTKSNQVQSRVKALEKLDRIEVDLEDRSRLNVKFPPAPRSGDVVYKGSDLTVGYPGKVVFSHADIEIRRGEKVALVGRNGEGKTTLMRVINKELDPLSGTSTLGHNVAIGYYEQNQEDVLDKKKTVFATLDDIAVGDIRTKLRDILAAFLFKGEDIDKPVSVLSGGERARLAMAKLMLKPYNLLALDEPTNHMDIRSKDVLKQALQAYDGTLVVVSHDRDFLDGLVDKIYEFRDGKVKEHLGSLADYLYRRKLESLSELERKEDKVDVGAAKGSAASSAAKGGAAAKTGNNNSIAAKEKSQAGGDIQAKGRELASPQAGGDIQAKGRELASTQADNRGIWAAKGTVDVKAHPTFVSKEERKLRQQIDKLEKEIEAKEAELKSIEARLTEPTPEDDIMKLTDAYLDCKSILDARTAQWEELLNKL